MRRGAILAAAAIPLFLIAMWVRTPALPRTAGNPAAGGGDRLNAAEGAVRALQRTLMETRDRLAERANGALDAPTDAKRSRVMSRLAFVRRRPFKSLARSLKLA